MRVTLNMSSSVISIHRVEGVISAQPHRPEPCSRASATLDGPGSRITRPFKQRSNPTTPTPALYSYALLTMLWSSIALKCAAIAIANDGAQAVFAQTWPTVPPSKAVGRLPALGWNSWNAYRCDVSDAKVLAAANSFVSLGLKDAGYQYVNIDDCWSLRSRSSSTGRIEPDPVKFPKGIVGTAQAVHALGLKIGIYSDAGTLTCAGYPGSLGREQLDATTFSDWGIDYLKYDNCNVPSNWTDSANPPGGDWYNSNSAIRFRLMTAALANVPRTIEYDICIWGQARVWTWGARVGHSWRMTGDSTPDWAYLSRAIAFNVQYLKSVDFFAHNDMDMMEIGNGNLNIQEQRTHFAVWAFMKSPILLGTNLAQLTSAELAIIKNKELLAFSQDTTIGTPAMNFTVPGAPVTSPPEYYAGTSSKGVHVFIINTQNSTATKSFALSSVAGLSASKTYRFHDMWTGQDLSGTVAGNARFSVSVAAHDTVAYLVVPVA
ncbi:glycoside hydrolase [Pterulicium gracile]|uniref:Alpha-galactosidase n=1 Tax=Pterulicium gracile TaxID=1884261 RepID=A0A5C3QHD1_9AGAR|nr:glycoside hydrolase [Pterula gracilis]